jgi:hypothetical protein
MYGAALEIIGRHLSKYNHLRAVMDTGGTTTGPETTKLNAAETLKNTSIVYLHLFIQSSIIKLQLYAKTNFEIKDEECGNIDVWPST